MKMFVEPADIYLYMDIVDFRKSINGLIVVVEQDMNLNPFRDALFIFRNKKRDKVKILYWDAELEALLEEKRARIAYLEEQFRVAQHKQFGKSTEGHPGQGELFNEAEELVVEAETAEETISYTRKKPTRNPLPKDLPREVIVHDISDEEKICGCCAGELHRIGEDKSEKLQFIPA